MNGKRESMIRFQTIKNGIFLLFIIMHHHSNFINEKKGFITLAPGRRQTPTWPGWSRGRRRFWRRSCSTPRWSRPAGRLCAASLPTKKIRNARHFISSQIVFCANLRWIFKKRIKQTVKPKRMSSSLKNKHSIFVTKFFLRILGSRVGISVSWSSIFTD